MAVKWSSRGIETTVVHRPKFRAVVRIIRNSSNCGWANKLYSVVVSNDRWGRLRFFKVTIFRSIIDGSICAPDSLPSLCIKADEVLLVVSIERQVYYVFEKYW